MSSLASREIQAASLRVTAFEVSIQMSSLASRESPCPGPCPTGPAFVSIQMSSLASREGGNLILPAGGERVSIQMSSLASRENRLLEAAKLREERFHSNEFSSE